jgi:hypothetical protein
LLKPPHNPRIIRALKSVFHTFRHRPRRFALFALLAICLHFAAMSVGNAHAIHRAVSGQEATLVGMAGAICHGTAATTADSHGSPAPEFPPFAPGGTHCPFCASSTVVLVPPAAALASFAPEPARVFIPPAAFDFLPAAPDFRHAPLRAPPVFSFA